MKERKIMKKSYKVLSCVLASSLMLSNTIPAMAAENGDAETVSNVTQTASIQVDDSGITINGCIIHRKNSRNY